MRLAPIGTAIGRAERGEPDVITTTPVAGDRAERREAEGAPVRGDADRVDAAAAYHGDTPPAVRSGAQERERVVLHDEARRPAERAESRLERIDLLVQIGSGK
jgi:hypothetical protein